MGGTSHFCETEIEPIPYKQRVNIFGYLQLYLILHVFIDEEFLMSFLKQRLYVGLSIILDTIIKKFDRRKPFEGTHRTVVCST